MKISVAHWCNDDDRRKLKYAERTLSQCHIFHYKPHIDWPGLERWCPPCEAGEN